MKIDEKGQITVELLLLISFALITTIMLANAIMDSNELNIAMASARNGAFEGISSSAHRVNLLHVTRLSTGTECFAQRHIDSTLFRLYLLYSELI